MIIQILYSVIWTNKTHSNLNYRLDAEENLEISLCWVSVFYNLKRNQGCMFGYLCVCVCISGVYIFRGALICPFPVCTMLLSLLSSAFIPCLLLLLAWRCKWDTDKFDTQSKHSVLYAWQHFHKKCSKYVSWGVECRSDLFYLTETEHE